MRTKTKLQKKTPTKTLECQVIALPWQKVDVDLYVCIQVERQCDVSNSTCVARGIWKRGKGYSTFSLTFYYEYD